MANHIRNTLRVIGGDPKEVFEAVRSELSVIDFQQLVPMPEQIKNSNEKVDWHGMKVNAWEAWVVEHWGTVKYPCDAQYFQTNAIDFDTPWCEPVPVFSALAKRFPNHEMVVTADYLDWGVDEYEIYFLKNGSVLSEGRKQYRYVGDHGESDKTA